MDNVYKARNDYDFRVLKKSIKVRKPSVGRIEIISLVVI